MRLTEAVTHLAARAGSGGGPARLGSHETGDARIPALTIEVWDEAETGVSRPLAPPPTTPARHWPTRVGDLLASADGRHVGCVTDHSALWLDRAAGRLTGHWTSAAALTLLERGKPFHFPLSVWLHDRGVHVVHAALVAWEGRGILMPGLGGAGKSTAALACALEGLDFLGDDHVGIAPSNGAWLGHSLYGVGWLEPGHLARFPGLVGRARSGPPPPTDKRLLLLAGASDETPDAHGGACASLRLRGTVPIRRIVLPRVAPGAPTGLRPAPRAEALRALTLGALVHVVPRPGPRELQQLGALAAAVPCHWLDLGHDLDGVARAIRAAVAEAADS